MSRVHKTVSLQDNTPVLLDLRAQGDTDSPFNQVGYLKLTFWSNTDDDQIVAVKPIVVKDGDTPPTPPAYPAFMASGDTADAIVMLALTDSSAGALNRATHEFGIPFSKGYEQDVYGSPVATHLAIAMKGTGDAFLTIEGQ